MDRAALQERQGGVFRHRHALLPAGGVRAEEMYPRVAEEDVAGSLRADCRSGGETAELGGK